MQFRLRQFSWAGALVLAMSGVLAGSLSAAAGSPVATVAPPEATAGPARANSAPIYESLVEARGGREPSDPGPLPIDDIRRILNEESKKPLFDGTVLGWRLAPDKILEEEGLSRNLSRECTPEL